MKFSLFNRSDKVDPEQAEADEFKRKAETVAYEKIIKEFPYGTRVTIDNKYSFYHGQKGVITGKSNLYQYGWKKGEPVIYQTFEVSLPERHESLVFDYKRLTKEVS